MLFSFFRAAMQTPERQFSFRAMVAVHLLALAVCAWLFQIRLASAATATGHILLVCGIVEGALLIGWRLTQLPKTRAFELVLASPLSPQQIFLNEAGIGILRLALVTLSGLPILLCFELAGYLLLGDLVPLLFLPFTIGTMVGLALTCWAYEPLRFRKAGERFFALVIIFYLIIGTLAGEHLKSWLESLPYGLGTSFIWSFHAFHEYNPFAVMQLAMTEAPEFAAGYVSWLLVTCLLIVIACAARAALRMQWHYQERHFSPVLTERNQLRPPIGDRPLTWWAIKRVSEYSGRINLWLAGGFSVLYAIHLVAGPHWPAWMGRRVFEIFDAHFGVIGIGVALVVLSAVPAAFQYGLWDSNVQDRCRRLELLLMTEIGPWDYWQAALAAAWRRGRGYIALATLIWLAAALGGRISAVQLAGALAGALVMWLLYFTIGFRAFTAGIQANTLGLVLTVGIPLLTYGLLQSGLAWAAVIMPPGTVYHGVSQTFPVGWLCGMLFLGMLAISFHREAINGCHRDLLRWYAQHQGGFAG